MKTKHWTDDNYCFIFYSSGSHIYVDSIHSTHCFDSMHVALKPKETRMAREKKTKTRWLNDEWNIEWFCGRYKTWNNAHILLQTMRISYTSYKFYLWFKKVKKQNKLVSIEMQFHMNYIFLSLFACYDRNLIERSQVFSCNCSEQQAI